MPRTATPAAISIIDIAPALAGDLAAEAEIAARVAEACERIGFLVVTGHGVPDDVIAGITSTARAFFDRPEAEKRRLDDPTAGSRYVPFRSESVAASLDLQTPPDLKEAFSLYRAGATQWPDDPPEFREAWLTYYETMEGLAARIMRLFALALGLEADWFARFIDRADASLWVSNYPAQTEVPESGQLRAGAHTDYDTLTILLVDDAPGGLQVERAPGDWHDVPVVPGSFVINIGDLMSRWTNGRWVSTMHRVANPPVGSGPATRRQSVVFFHKPNDDALIEPIPTCVGPGSPVRFEPVLAGEYMAVKGAKQDDSHRPKDER